ncbi:MAG TPA: hypothetical protein VMR45_06025 [Patescibacteria group bacterium]|nr:hypothetical protein [Patescibacteria group bacterium]
MPVEQERFSESPEPDEPSPELEEYFYQEPSVDPSTVVTLPNIPKLIGGPRSKKFILGKPGSSPDAPPNPNSVIDLRKVFIPPEAEDAYQDFLLNAEQQADSQYEVALFEAQEALTTAREKGIEVQTLFVPDIARGASDAYERRLRRLAQDTGCRIIIGKKKLSTRGALDFETFDPPRANGIQDYWAGRTGTQASPEVQPKTRETRPQPSEDQTRQALMSLGSGSQNVQSLNQNLSILRDCSTEQLRRHILDSNIETDNIPTIVQDLAYRSCLIELDHQLAQSVAAKIICANMQADPEFAAATMQRTQQLIDGETLHLNGKEKQDLLKALLQSEDPRAGEFVATYLDVPPDAGRTYARILLSPIVNGLPAYIKALKAMPNSPEQQSSLAALEKQLEKFVGGILSGQLQAVYDFSYNKNTAGDLLLQYYQSGHRDLLRKFLLSVYEKGGSIITDPEFERRYLKYREIYGDIPGIQPECISGTQPNTPSDAVTTGTGCSMGEVIEVVLATITTANESSLAAQGIVSAIELSRDNLTAILESTNNAQAREILDCLETAINKLKAAQEASRISAKSLGGYGAL